MSTTPWIVEDTGLIHRCLSCQKKMLAIEHNGSLMVKAGRKSVLFQSGSIQCDGCGHWNHITLKQKTNVVD